MRRVLWGVALAMLLGLTIPAWAGGDVFVGSYSGSAKLIYEMPVYGTTQTYDGTAEMTITKLDENTFRVESVTRFTGMPESVDASVYKFQGASLTFNEVMDEMGVVVEQSGKLDLAGSKLTGSVSVMGQLEGQVQTKSTTTFDLTKQ